jgi:UDP-N-acetylmuramoyl-L-alanyl-D-glutamate--2,6-diaminopimelate ligase
MVALSRISAALSKAGLLRKEHGELPQTVSGITDDSRLVLPGTLFIAVPGTATDGHLFLDAAEQSGATVAIVERANGTRLPTLVVHDARRAASVAAAEFYGNPAGNLTLIAVTGTNGKTTTVTLLRHLLDTPGAPAASIGTLGVLVGSAGPAFTGGAGLTTPGAVELHRVLRALADSGVRSVAMEASSHALDQHRLDGLAFACAVFTNLTRDHLDYHGTMEAYFASKAALISLLRDDGVAIVNADDPAWRALPSAQRRLTFGLSSSADVRAAQLTFTPEGSRWTLRTGAEAVEVRMPLIGDFNVANALGAAAGALALGIPVRAVAERLGSAPQTSGRLERLSDEPIVLRDYAHTPDALERALRAVRPFAGGGRVIVVFGCGGDRDPGKRPAMGAIAEEFADIVILTSDNPRTEDPERILDDIERGMNQRTHERIEDRRAAIERAIDLAERGRDVVLLAGKGHETYQIRGTHKLPFDERDIVNELVAARGA